MLTSTGIMTWRVKDSFLQYVARTPGSEVSIGEGAEHSEDDGFCFPLTDSSGFDYSTNSGTILFEGNVRFVGHVGLMFVHLGNPSITALNGGGTLSFEDRAERQRIDVAVVDWQPPAPGDCRLTWTNLSTSLTAAGVELFNGVYPAGEQLAPISVTLRR